MPRSPVPSASLSPDLRELVRLHGGELMRGGRAALIPGPGHSRADRSLSLRLGDGGRVVFYSHVGDDCARVMDYLGVGAPAPGRRDLKARMQLVERERRAQARADEALCARIWNASGPIGGTAAEAWLGARGLEPPACLALRFHPQAPRGKHPEAATHPAMVALACDREGRPRALHLTFITPDGAKAFGPRSRLIFGPAAGAAVRLMPVSAHGGLAVAEGIETALAYAGLTGRPAWACLSAAGLKTFQVPAGVRRLVVAADHDANGAGLAAATALAERACRRARVEVEMPANVGADWCDVLTGRAP